MSMHNPTPMKTKLLLIASLSCALAGILPARDYITTVENTPNLLGYWRFSAASQANSEVNGYTGTFMGNAGVGPVNSGPGITGDAANSAALLDGTTNTFVNTNLTGQIDTQGSMVGWFY